MKKLLFFGWLTITHVVFGQEALGEVVGTVVEDKSGAIV
ncbi:MAG: hypothetical protein RJA13_2375, partial [Bacteroidota bacterium]